MAELVAAGPVVCPVLDSGRAGLRALSGIGPAEPDVRNPRPVSRS
ncbi:hypothetical protein [Actinoplanes sp. NPDC026670]